MNHSATNHSAKNNQNKRLWEKEVSSIESAIRYVAYMDVMGFKDMVARNPHNVIGEKLQNLLIFISDLINNKGSIFSSIFSDSIYFFTSDDKQTTLKALIEILSKVMKYALSVGLPMKGAIAKGEVSIDLVKNLTFGQPLIDAYLIVESIVLYGIVIHNSVEDIVRKKAFQNYVMDTKIPLKSGNCVTLYIKVVAQRPQKKPATCTRHQALCFRFAPPIHRQHARPDGQRLTAFPAPFRPFQPHFMRQKSKKRNSPNCAFLIIS